MYSFFWGIGSHRTTLGCLAVQEVIAGFLNGNFHFAFQDRDFDF